MSEEHKDIYEAYSELRQKFIEVWIGSQRMHYELTKLKRNVCVTVAFIAFVWAVGNIIDHQWVAWSLNLLVLLLFTVMARRYTLQMKHQNAYMMCTMNMVKLWLEDKEDTSLFSQLGEQADAARREFLKMMGQRVDE